MYNSKIVIKILQISSTIGSKQYKMYEDLMKGRIVKQSRFTFTSNTSNNVLQLISVYSIRNV